MKKVPVKMVVAIHCLLVSLSSAKPIELDLKHHLKEDSHLNRVLLGKFEGENIDAGGDGV